MSTPCVLTTCVVGEILVSDWSALSGVRKVDGLWLTPSYRDDDLHFHNSDDLGSVLTDVSHRT